VTPRAVRVDRVRRPLLIGVIAGGLALIILIVVAVIVIAGIIDRQNALEEHEDAATEFAGVVGDSELAIGEADQIIAIAASEPLLPAEAVAAVTVERDAASAALTEADALDTDPETLGTEEVRDLSADIRSASSRLSDDDELVFAALGDLVLATQTAAAAVESANFEAENAPHIAYRHAVADLDVAPDDSIAEYLVSYLGAAHALEASHAEEIAEKAGPLFDRRMAVEQFARSIAGGVLLEFDWAAVVNGYGTGGTYGGTSYWVAADGGYATITLSDSVASMWPGTGVQSLVVHEIGHAVLSLDRCYPLFFDSEFESGGEEPWATAWAIGMGFTADGNGESIYGRPSDGLIQLSTQCR
jgi:hypothetical protein